MREWINIGIISTILAAVSGCAQMGGESRATLATRDDRVAGRDRRSEGDLGSVPPAADTRTPPPHETGPATPPGGTQETTPLVEKPQLAIAIYGATWCGPCQLLKRIIPDLKARGFIVVYRDIDEHPNPHAKILPTTYLYRDGACFHHIVGPTTIEAIEEAFR